MSKLLINVSKKLFLLVGNENMILSDKDVREQIQLNKIIVNGFDPNRLKGASYGLTAGDSYFDLTEDPSLKITAKNEDGKKILIKPLHKVVLITQEELDIPNNMLGRVATKGSLFSIGLSAINTLADPGFKGKLGLVFYNFSSKYIILDVGQEIAKIDFNELKEDSTTPYSGQHGFSMMSWPVPRYLQHDYSAVKNHERIKSSPLEEAYTVLPFEISSLLKNLKAGVTGLQWTLITIVISNVAIVYLVFNNKIDNFTASIFINLISSIIVAAYALFAKFFIKKQ